MDMQWHKNPRVCSLGRTPAVRGGFENVSDISPFFFFWGGGTSVVGLPDRPSFFFFLGGEMF